jgi:hypothetical protein
MRWLCVMWDLKGRGRDAQETVEVQSQEQKETSLLIGNTLGRSVGLFYTVFVATLAYVVAWRAASPRSDMLYTPRGAGGDRQCDEIG